jgi:hypothetical protein
MNSKNRIQPLFSIGMFLSVSAAFAGTYFLSNQLPEKQDPIHPAPSATSEPNVVIPPVELPPPVLEVPTVEIKGAYAPAVKPPTHTLVRAKVAQAVKVSAPRACEMVCDTEWHTSAYGTRFKPCECK